MHRGLHWFRADLRVKDNTALIAAMRECDSVLAVFILTRKTWARHDAAPIKIQFILNNLAELSVRCAKVGIPLLIRECDYFSECPRVIKKICDEHQIDAVYFNKQYEFDEARRDHLVTHELGQKITIHDYDDQLIMPPGTVLSQQEKPLQIFTPFKNTWLKHVTEHDAWLPIQESPRTFKMGVQPDLLPTVNPIDNWPAGEKAAHQRLQLFCQQHISHYHEQRDFPSIAGTSQLSAYLAQGVLSPSQCVQAIMTQLSLSNFSDIQKNVGAATWLSELIWREFYKHIMYFHPEVCRHQPYKKITDKIPWRYDKDDFESWCQGKTGFPLVDAAMRQLNQTGWMHNRLRMVVAMFLSKTLFIDWRWGEKYFMQNLIDGDLAANNGGWQWSASTGTDAVPYFRIFNPTTQSERFDPEGIFIRQFCPELARLNNKAIHSPYAHGVALGSIDYPQPIVDYPTMRTTVIAAFKSL
ncbi:MAG: deoxyribodipyrimidine photo-lyase [Pseudomonadota bacterium]|nr:deoxyribodipyrimidine photo-lyase [Pseudomonadota bacterium]